MQKNGISILPDDERTTEQLTPKLDRVGFAFVFILFIWGLLASMKRTRKGIQRRIPS